MVDYDRKASFIDYEKEKRKKTIKTTILEKEYDVMIYRYIFDVIQDDDELEYSVKKTSKTKKQSDFYNLSFLTNIDTKEKGNELYKNLIKKGYKKVLTD